MTKKNKMRVISIDVDTENREVMLSIEGMSAYTIMQSDFGPLDIAEGDDIDEQIAEEIIYFDEKLRCVKQAFKHLSYADCSSGRLSKKLLQKFSQRASAETVQLLVDHGYLRDAELCAEYARNNYEIKRHGPIRIRRDLYNLGFASEIVSEVLEEYESMDHSENLEFVLSSRFRSRDPQNRQKAFAMLYRLGYPYDDVREAVENYFESEL